MPRPRRPETRERLLESEALKRVAHLLHAIEAVEQLERQLISERKKLQAELQEKKDALRKKKEK